MITNKYIIKDNQIFEVVEKTDLDTLVSIDGLPRITPCLILRNVETGKQEIIFQSQAFRFQPVPFMTEIETLSKAEIVHLLTERLYDQISKFDDKATTLVNSVGKTIVDLMYENVVTKQVELPPAHVIKFVQTIVSYVFTLLWIAQEKKKQAPSKEKIKRQLADQIVKEAIALRDSGYDGPFIGDVCTGLFDSISKYETIE